MTARRTAAGLAGLVALAGCLSGCTKPSPGITVVSSGHSTYLEASEWCRGGATLLKGTECPGTGKKLGLLHANQGDQVGIDVDRTLTRKGWYLYDADTKQNVSGFVKTGYWTFTADYSGSTIAGVQQLEVRSVDHVPTSNTDIPKITGEWPFVLVPRSD